LALPSGRPRLTYGLFAAIVLVFAAMTLAGGSTDTQVLVRFGAKDNVLIAEGQVWRLLASMFLHIGVMHLVFNSYALLVLGSDVERLYGSPRFLAIYLLAGLWGGLASFALSPDLSAGASGAIFGLLGAMVAFLRREREVFGSWGRQRLLNLLGVAALNLVLGFTVPGIDNFAHLGGLFSGAVLGWLLAPRYQVAWDDRYGPHLADRSRRLARWGIIILAVVLWVGATGAAMTLQRQSAAVLIYQGQQALQRNDPAAAESLFRRAISSDSSSAEADLYLGVALANQGKTALAAEAYQAALRLQPDLAEAHWNLALAYVALDRPQDAITEFESFITLRPDSPDAGRARAIMAQLGR
jgi:rhomboid protease GluP